MAAPVLACELDLDLFRIGLDQVVSESIGETESHRRLLFDESGTRFGRRREVRDAHDR